VQTLKDTPVLNRERELELFRRYNYLKFLAWKTRTGIKLSRVSSTQLTEIENHLAEAEDIKVKSLYKYDEERWQQQTIRFVSFANDEEHNLGNTPIPNGNVKIYSQTDEQAYLSYVGGTSVKYIPVNEEVELNLGPARLVSVEPILMDFKTDNYMFDRKNNVSGWDEMRTWKINITNTRELPIEIEITRGFGTAYWTLQHDGQDISYEKHDATHARFKTAIEPRIKRTFGYTVRTYHGAREEALTK